MEFIHLAIQDMQKQLQKMNSSLLVRYGKPADIFRELVKEYRIGKVFTNHDYEPYARSRDEEVRSILNNDGISFHAFKDHVIFERNEVLKDDGKPYTVFTPYSRRWKALVNDFYLRAYPCNKYFSNFFATGETSIPSLEHGIILHYHADANLF